MLNARAWPAGTRVALGIEYDGSNFHGWQAQPHLDCATVQEALDSGLSQIAAMPIRSHCAGRTDTGVHGLGQVVHFDDPVGRSEKAWVLGTNTQLPASVRVRWAHAVPSSFHARHSAIGRRYRYVIANTAVQSALLVGRVTPYRRVLDHSSMHEAAQVLVGEHDFSAFRAAQCQAQSPVREVTSLAVTREGDFVFLDIAANAFLHHMVRNIAGSLLMVGAGLRPSTWIAELLQGRDRTRAADTAAGDGLYLAAVEYPRQFGLPCPPQGPFLLSGFGG